MRFIVFLVIAFVVHFGANKLAGYLGITIDQTSYIIGLAVASTIGGVWFIVGGWWGTAMSVFQPQTVRLQTESSPFQVTAAAGLGCLFFLVSMAAMIVVLYLMFTGTI